MKWLSVFALFLALVAAENPEGRLICICCVELAYILTRTNVSLFIFLRNHTKQPKRMKIEVSVPSQLC